MSTMVNPFSIQCRQHVIWLFSRAQRSHDRSVQAPDATDTRLCSISIYHKVFVPARPFLIEKCLIYQHVHPVPQLLLNNGYIECSKIKRLH